MQAPANAPVIAADHAPAVRGKQRLCTLSHLDGRTRASKRARELAAAFAGELGSLITATQRLAIERAAALVALSEDAKARRLSGDQSITLDDVVRIDGAMMRAVKALALDRRAKPAGPSLHEHLAARAAERAGKPPEAPA